MSLDRFGPYFALVRVPDPAPRGWIRLSELDAEQLDRRVDQFGEAISMATGPSPADTRALASVMLLGFFARLLSPAIGAALTREPTACPDPEAIWLGPGTGSLPTLGTSQPEGAAHPAASIERLALPLVDRASEQFGLARPILLGNLAAAVVGACEVVAAIDPPLAGAAAALRHDLLSEGPLAGTGTTSGAFVRTSCCLNHRLPMDYICGNCPLVAQHTPTAARIRAEMARLYGG